MDDSPAPRPLLTTPPQPIPHALDIGGAEAEREWLAALRDEAIAGGRA